MFDVLTEFGGLCALAVFEQVADAVADILYTEHGAAEFVADDGHEVVFGLVEVGEFLVLEGDGVAFVYQFAGTGCYFAFQVFVYAVQAIDTPADSGPYGREQEEGTEDKKPSFQIHWSLYLDGDRQFIGRPATFSGGAFDAEGEFAVGQTGEAEVVLADIDPVFVHTFYFVRVAALGEFIVVEQGEFYLEGDLPGIEGDFFIPQELGRLAFKPPLSGIPYIIVSDVQSGKGAVEFIEIFGMETIDARDTAKQEAAVREFQVGAAVEFVVGQPVAFVKDVDGMGPGVKIDEPTVAGHPEAALFVFKDGVEHGVDEPFCEAKPGDIPVAALPFQESGPPGGHPEYPFGLFVDIGDAVAGEFRKSGFDALLRIYQV